MGKREEKKQAKRTEIFNVAIRLFDKLGYDNVTTAQIAAECHIAKKTLFQYFASKENIIFDDEDGLLETVLIKISPAGDVWKLFVAWLTAEHDDAGANMAGVPEALRLPEIIGSSDALTGRLLKMWNKYQVRLTDYLVSERQFSSLSASALSNIMVHVLSESFGRRDSVEKILEANEFVADMICK